MGSGIARVMDAMNAVEMNDRDRLWLSAVQDSDELRVPWTTNGLVQTHHELMVGAAGS